MYLKEIVENSVNMNLCQIILKTIGRLLNLQIENVNLKCDYFLANINKLLEKLEKRSIQELINE